MKEETRLRARNDVILNAALEQGLNLRMNELEIFEKLVHYLLNIKDEVMQERLDQLLYSPMPPMMLTQKQIDVYTSTKTRRMQ